MHSLFYVCCARVLWRLQHRSGRSREFRRLGTQLDGPDAKIWVRRVTAELLRKHWYATPFPEVLGRYANHNFLVATSTSLNHFTWRICRKTMAKHSNRPRYQLNQMSQMILILFKTFHKKKSLSNLQQLPSKPSQRDVNHKQELQMSFQQLPEPKKSSWTD